MTKRPKPSVPAPTLRYHEAVRLAKPLIHEICALSGTPGLAIGVFGQNGKILDYYHGYRDIRRAKPPNPDTVFNLGSMCKGFTAMAIACLVADGKVHWDDRIDTFLSDLRASPNGAFSIRDLLSHRSGLCRSDALFIGSDNRLLLTKSQGTDVYAALGASRPPRQDFIYNNFGYHAVGCVIEQVSSMNYGDFLADRIFKPLNMDRTFTTFPSPEDDNIAQAYIPYYNLRPRHVPAPSISNDTVAFAAGCIRSCMRDLIKFYSALLGNFSEVMPTPILEKVKSISSDVRAIFEATIPFKVPTSIREQSYSMGWARTQLPNQMSELSGNSGLLDAYPIIGDGTKAPLILHHGGNNIGCSSSVYMFPELGSGIIVLGNALGHCDATDWAAQIITEAYLQRNIQTPFGKYANEAALRGRSAMAQVQAILDSQKKPSNPPSTLNRYLGVYWHKTMHFNIIVTQCANSEERLNMSFQGLDSECYGLRHYYQDIFVFNETFDEVMRRGQWCRPYWFYKIEFLSQGSEIHGLRWRTDDTEEHGQIFKKSK